MPLGVIGVDRGELEVQWWLDFVRVKVGKGHNSPSTFPRWVPPSDRSIIKGDWCQNDRLFVNLAESLWVLVNHSNVDSKGWNDILDVIDVLLIILWPSWLARWRMISLRLICTINCTYSYVLNDDLIFIDRSSLRYLFRAVLGSIVRIWTVPARCSISYNSFE